jgi:signal recognition particle GTPase
MRYSNRRRRENRILEVTEFSPKSIPSVLLGSGDFDSVIEVF